VHAEVGIQCIVYSWLTIGDGGPVAHVSKARSIINNLSCVDKTMSQCSCHNTTTGFNDIRYSQERLIRVLKELDILGSRESP